VWEPARHFRHGLVALCKQLGSAGQTLLRGHDCQIGAARNETMSNYVRVEIALGCIAFAKQSINSAM
jgi:hypothetical protein